MSKCGNKLWSFLTLLLTYSLFRHTTANLLYTDTLNFLLKSVEDGKSTLVTAFSISQLGGSYGDEGQNYYNLVSLMNSISWTNEFHMKHADGSCPAPK
jgi:hypothetical protein